MTYNIMNIACIHKKKSCLTPRDEWCPTRQRIIAPYGFAANLKTGPVIYTKGYLGSERYDSVQSRTEQHAGCILKRILVWLMDPF